ncbi:MAG: histidine phosphatase family protein [Ruminococcus sp.]|nr:histidine phosphatase family protein [Ruminococcus sp.]
MKIYFARHGQTDWNKNNKVCGLTDVSLTEKGKEQAKNLAEKLLTENIDIIISSPLKRAVQTGEIISSVIGVPIIIDNRVIEQSYGIYEGVDIHNQDFLENKKNFAYKYPGGESMMQVAARVYSLIEEFKLKYQEKNVLVVCHGGVCRIANTYFCDMTNQEFFNFNLPNAEYNKYDV